MALLQSKLKDNFVSWMEVPYDDAKDSAEAFVAAYDGYALDAADIAHGNPSAGMVSAAEGALSGLSSLENLPATAAAMFANAMVLYWTGVVFSGGTVPPPGTILPIISELVSVPPVPASVIAVLSTVFADLATEDVETKALQMAIAFHTATLLTIVAVVATIPPPGAGPAPPVPGPIS